MADEAQVLAAQRVVAEGLEKAEREARRRHVLQLVRESDSTAQLLQLVLECHLELVREALVDDDRPEPTVPVEVATSIEAPWSLTVGLAEAYGQTAPALLREQIEEFRDEEESDLLGDAPPAAVVAPSAEPGILEEQVLVAAGEWTRALAKYSEAYDRNQAAGTLYDAAGSLTGETRDKARLSGAAELKLRALAEQLPPEPHTDAGRGTILRALRDVTRYAEVFVDALLEVGPESEMALRGVDAVLAAKMLTGEGPGAPTPAAAVKEVA